MNQHQVVVSGDGRWKLQLPHTYRTLAGRQGRNDGTLIPYEQRKLEQAEFYDAVAAQPIYFTSCPGTPSSARDTWR